MYIMYISFQSPKAGIHGVLLSAVEHLPASVVQYRHFHCTSTAFYLLCAFSLVPL